MTANDRYYNDPIETTWAYLCGLTSKYGMTVTYEQAEGYSRREYMQMSPNQVMQNLHANDWGEVISLYKLYIGSDAAARRLKKYFKARASKYSDEELIAIVEDCRKKLGNQSMTRRLFEEIRQTKTGIPDPQTFYNRLGPGWLTRDFRDEKKRPQS